MKITRLRILAAAFLALSSCARDAPLADTPGEAMPRAYLRHLSDADPPEAYPRSPDELEAYVESLISIATPDDAARKRAELVAFVWGAAGLPAGKAPARITRDHRDDRYRDLYGTSLARIDRVLVTMDFGLESTVDHFIPRAGNGRLAVYHEGHVGYFDHTRALVGDLLAAGYAVATAWMPLAGPNNRPAVFVPGIGDLVLDTHDVFKFLAPAEGHPVQYFLEPVVVFLSYAAREHAYDDVTMIGLSGGGWTTTLAAALDLRIDHSFPVAGTLPIFLRYGPDWGDWEQTVPELFRVANYLDLYVLGAHGPGRSQLQILNRDDPCCFAAAKGAFYAPAVRRRVEALGEGRWDLFVDDSHRRHEISQAARQRILGSLDR